MSDLAATNCGCECGNGDNGCGSLIWILLLLCCCGGNNGSFLSNGSGCDNILPLFLILQKSKKHFLKMRRRFWNFRFHLLFRRTQKAGPGTSQPAFLWFTPGCIFFSFSLFPSARTFLSGAPAVLFSLRIPHLSYKHCRPLVSDVSFCFLQKKCFL